MSDSDSSSSPSLFAKLLRILSLGVQWGVAAFLALCAVVFLPSMSSALFAVAALLAAPIPPLRKALSSGIALLPIGAARAALTPALVIALFLGGVFNSPAAVAASTAQSQQTTRSASITQSQEASGAEVALIHLLAHTDSTAQTEVAKASDGMILEKATLSASTTVLEYSNKTTDPTSLVTSSDNAVKVTTNDKIDLTKVGACSINYTLTKGTASKQEKVDYSVRDTKAPTLTLSRDSVAIDQGGAFDPKSLATATDPVDGDLPYVTAEPATDKTDPGNQQFYEKGWWTVAGSYDVNTPNVYFLDVVACDINGNRVSKEVSLTVNEPPKPEPEETYVEPERQTQAYMVNTNTGKFHRTTCKDINKMSDSNKWLADEYTRDELISMGYSPCKHCNP